MAGRHVDVDEIEAQIEGQDNSLLGNVARALSRPAYALRSALRGDLEGAAANLGQLALDIPTGGFLDRRLSLANLVNERGDLTTAKQRPEFEDLVDYRPENPFARFALNFAGGIATDPLSLLTFGGGGLARGALQGLGRTEAAAALAGGLRETAAGRGLLKLGAGADELERALGLGAGKLGATNLAEEHALVDRLTKGGQLLQGDALRIGETPLVGNIWGKLGGATLPGLALRGLDAASPETATALRKAVAAAWEYAKTNFYDRKLSGLVPEGMRRAAVEAGVNASARARAGDLVARRIAELAPEAERRTIGERFLRLQDEWARRSKEVPYPSLITNELQQKLEEGLSSGGVLAAREWQAASAAARAEWAKAGIDIPANPFYVPRQATDEVNVALRELDAAAAARPGAQVALGQNLKSRKHGSLEEWLAALREVKPEAQQLADVAETDLAKLALRYADSNPPKIAKLELQKAAEQMRARYGDEIGPLDQYVARQFENVNAAPGPLRKLLRKTTSYYKPALTVMLPSFHARNAVSNVIQTALDPELGLGDGAAALLGVIRNGPAIATGKKLGLEAEQSLTIMRAIDGDRAARQAVEAMKIGKLEGKEFLKHMDAVAGGHQAGSADLFDSLSTAQRLGTSPGASLRNPLSWIRAWRDFGTKTGNYVENSFRAHAFMRLLEKGVDPTKAVQRVNRIFVDYSPNSTREKALRDAFPFLRYSLAIAPVAAEQLARRPGALVHQGLRTLEGERAQDGAPEGTSLALGGGTYLGSLGLPQEAAASLLGAPQSLENARKFLAGSAPVPKAAVEAILNRSLLTGEEWGTNRRAPWALSAAGLATERKGADGEPVQEINPAVGELLRASPLSRFLGVADQLFGGKEDTAGVDRVAKLLLGVSRVTPDQRAATLRAVRTYLHDQAKAGNVIESKRFFARLEDGQEPPEELLAAIEAEAALRKKPKG